MQDFRTPGQLIESLLQERGWTKSVLATVLEFDNAALSKVMSGKRAVSAELAIALQEVFGVPAEQFLELQKSYELEQARIVVRPNEKRAARAALFANFPIAEMVQRQWLDAESARDIPQVERAILKFFGVDSAEQIDLLPFAAKKTDTLDRPSPAQMAWINRVKQMAREMVVPRYTRSGAVKAIEQLRQLCGSAEEARNVPRILAEAGIRFVLVESLKGAKIDGVCFWLDENSPVIGMSLRLDRIDNFWFVLRHELEHVLREHAKLGIVLDTDLEIERDERAISEEERVANDAASNFCVRTESLKQFIARKSPIFSERDLLGFARTESVHPGIVVGQLQRKTERYELFRPYLTKIRTIVCPSAMVDGWGDVAPVGL